MNKLIIVCTAFLLFSVCQAAPQDALTRFYGKYRSDTAVAQLTIPKFLLRVFADDPDLRKALRYMKSLRLFTAEGDGQTRRAIHRDFEAAMAADGYEDALQIHEGEELINIRVREEDNLINGVVICITNDREMVLLHAGTRITYEELKRMMGYLQTEKGRSGLKHVASGKS